MYAIAVANAITVATAFRKRTGGLPVLGRLKRKPKPESRRSAAGDRIGSEKSIADRSTLAMASGMPDGAEPNWNGWAGRFGSLYLPLPVGRVA
jgi:hypothetical protein